MALQFTPSTEAEAQAKQAAAADTAAAPLNIQVNAPQEFSIVDKTEEIKQELVKNEEVDKLVSTININDVNSIVKFGNEVAMEISKASDQVLNSMNMDQINDSGQRASRRRQKGRVCKPEKAGRQAACEVPHNGRGRGQDIRSAKAVRD